MNTTDISQLTAQGRDYLAAWTRLISEGIGRLGGGSVTVEALSGEELTRETETADAGVWIRFFGGKAGEQAFFLPEEGALRLAKLLLGRESEPFTLSDEGREAVIQFFQQTATMIPLAEWLGADGELDLAGSDRPAWESAGQAAFRFSTPEGSLFTLRAHLSGDFQAALQAAKAGSKTEGKKEPPPSSFPFPGAVRDIHLELLMDVELEVSLRFGRREMLLKDVLNLTPGSVVELDQQVQDPVELLVGSKVIAWGEVVAVDGNYGLRITGLASREERLESLRK